MFNYGWWLGLIVAIALGWLVGVVTGSLILDVLVAFVGGAVLPIVGSEWVDSHR